MLQVAEVSHQTSANAIVAAGSAGARSETSLTDLHPQVLVHQLDCFGDTQMTRVQQSPSRTGLSTGRLQWSLKLSTKLRQTLLPGSARDEVGSHEHGLLR